MSEPLNNPQNVLKLHPIDGEFIGTINLESLPQNLSNSACQTIIILDQSGSMGENVKYIVNKILPAFFKKLHYKDEKEIHLITFSNKACYACVAIKDLRFVKMQAEGTTLMSHVFKYLHALMEAFKTEKASAVRILTISDGEIFDKLETKTMSGDVAELAKQFEVSINSQAVRFFTSLEGQPDTTALCCLLQLNNVTTSKLLDTQSDEKFEAIVDKWAALFADDELMNIVELQCDSKIFRKNPWDEVSKDKIRMAKGQNVFWVKEKPKNVKINGADVQTIAQPPMNLEKFGTILNETLDVIIDQMKILKIIDSESGQATIDRMVEYFKRVEEGLIADDVTDELDDDCKISNLLDAIANDEVSKLNPSEKAEYLRSAKKLKKSPRKELNEQQKDEVDPKDEQLQQELIRIEKQELDWQARKKSLQLVKVEQKEKALSVNYEALLSDFVEEDSTRDVAIISTDEKFDWELLLLTIIHRCLRFITKRICGARR